MSDLTITPDGKDDLLQNKNEISMGKAVLLLTLGGIFIFGIATWIGYQYFWYKPAYSSVEEYRLETAVSNVKKYPGNAALRVELGWNYLQNGNYDAAEKEFKNAIKLDEGNLGAKINLAMVYAEKGDLAKSKELLKKTIKEKPAAPDVHLALGQLLIQTKEYDDAIKEFNYLLDLNPGTVDFLYLIGKSYEGKGEHKKAKEYYEKSLKYVPDYPKAKLALENIKRAEVSK